MKSTSKIPQWTIDRIKELKQQWLSHRDIKNVIDEELWTSLWLATISRHASDVSNKLQESAKKLEKIVHENDLDENLDEEINDNHYDVINWDVVIKYKVDGVDFVMEIPLDVVDWIFRDFSRKPWWWRLTSYQIIEKYNLQQYCIGNGNRVINLLRSRMNLNQYCDLLSPATIHDIKIKNGEKELKKVLTERARAAVRWNLDEDRTFNKIYQKEQTDYLLKIAKTHQDAKLYYKWLEEKISLAKLDIPTLPKYKEKNKEFMVVMFWDLHWWTKTHERMEARMNKMADDIISSWVWRVRLLGMWDWFETIAKGTWIMHADQYLDMKYFWPELWEKMFSLFMWFFAKLWENGVVAEFDMMLGNHDRWWEGNWEDRYRSAWYPLYMLLREALKTSNVKVNILIDRVNSIMIWDTNYIIGHGEKDLMKMSAEEAIMMWWIRSAKYYIIWQWHLHSYKKKEWNVTVKKTRELDDMEWYNYTKIIVPPMCDPAFYSEQVIAKRSACWCVKIVENEDCPPDIILKRL